MKRKKYFLAILIKRIFAIFLKAADLYLRTQVLETSTEKRKF